MIVELILAAIMAAVPAAPAEHDAPPPAVYEWHGEKWDTYKGLNMNGPSGPETGYNLPMDGVVYLPTSRGMGIVVDTGYFAYGPTQLDLAFAW